LELSVASAKPAATKSAPQAPRTAGKPGGKGFGLYQVNKMLENCGGRIDVISTVGGGSSFKLIMPEYTKLNILDPIIIEPYSEILILDDDDLVHEMWEMKFKNQNITHDRTHLKSPAELYNWLKSKNSLDNTIGFFDYNLKDDITGLELLVRNNFAKKLLLTGEANKISIIDKCAEKDITLIDKSDFGDINFISNLKIRSISS